MLNQHAVPRAEFVYDDLGVSLIKPHDSGRDGVHAPVARILILPDWQGGHTDYAARMATIFGKALQAETLIFNQYPASVQPKTYLGDGDVLVAELLSNLDHLCDMLRQLVTRSQAHWDTLETPLILIGFCFGGTASFEAARTAVPVDMAFSVHGTPVVDPARMRANVAGPSMHYIGGDNDRLVPSWTVSAFREEIAQTNVRGSIHFIPGQRHSFTKKEVGYVGPLSRYSALALSRALELTSELVTRIPNGSHFQEGNVR